MTGNSTANDFNHDLRMVLFREVQRGGQVALADQPPDAPLVARLGDREYAVAGVAFEDGRVVIALAEDGASFQRG